MSLMNPGYVPTQEDLPASLDNSRLIAWDPSEAWFLVRYQIRTLDSGGYWDVQDPMMQESINLSCAHPLTPSILSSTLVWKGRLQILQQAPSSLYHVLRPLT
jgi:hypothetical protein